MNTRYFTLGTFVVVTLGAFGWLAMQLGLGDRGGTHYTVRTHDAAGLIEGNSVRIAGVEVGKVEKIRVDGNQAVIDVRVRRGITVFADACAAVHIKGMLGEKYLGIEQNMTGEPMAPGATFGCVTRTVDFDNALNATRDVVYGEESLLPVVTRIAKRIDTMTSSLDQRDASTEPAGTAATVDDPAGGPVQAAPQAGHASVQELMDATRDLLRLSHDVLQENRDDVRASMQGLRKLVEDPQIQRMLRDGSQLLDTLTKRTPRLLDEAEKALKKLERVADLVNDQRVAKIDAILDDSSASIKNLRKISEDFKDIGRDVKPLVRSLAPLFKNLNTLAERATNITEASIRQLLQMEGFRVRLGQGREARQFMREQKSGKDAN